MNLEIAHPRSRDLAEALASSDPDRYTMSAACRSDAGGSSSTLKKRTGHDCGRRHSGRVGGGRTMGAPIEWSELETKVLRPASYTIEPTATRERAKAQRGESDAPKVDFDQVARTPELSWLHRKAAVDPKRTSWLEGFRVSLCYSMAAT